MTQENILKGLAAGFVAGAAATLAKTIWEEYFPVRDQDTETPPAKLAERIEGRELEGQEEEVAEQSIHAGFGIGTGVLYGLAAEAVPPITTAAGLPFGVGFYALTHGSVVPALGLEPWPTEVKPQYAVNEFAGHLVYAVVLEGVRRSLR